MIRTLTPGRTAYRVNLVDRRTNAYRPHLEAIAIVGAARPSMDGQPVTWVRFAPESQRSPGTTEVMSKFLYPTPARARSAFIREWRRDGQTVTVEES